MKGEQAEADGEETAEEESQDLAFKTGNGGGEVVRSDGGEEDEGFGGGEFGGKLEVRFGRLALFLGELLSLVAGERRRSWLGDDDFILENKLLGVEELPGPVVLGSDTSSHHFWNGHGRTVYAQDGAGHALEIERGVSLHEGDGMFAAGCVWEEFTMDGDEVGIGVSLLLGESVEIDGLDGEMGGGWFLDIIGGYKVDGEEEEGGASEDGVGDEGGSLDIVFDG
jgi:hypothetical protein